jgi:hypothetical protein
MESLMQLGLIPIMKMAGSSTSGHSMNLKPSEDTQNKRRKRRGKNRRRVTST